ncbi:hypothetical protein GCM10018962_77680 [Dactylosporangium matsuzakiense]|uniref:hypothetical protein n=1 Tax=Dactylosporangium matsuzakiense TaxID=53360 RepID=UPI0031EA855B
MKSETLKIWQAILAGLLVVSGAANLGDLMPDKVAAWVVLAIGALSAATGYYTAHVGTTPADSAGSGRQLY